MKSYLRIHVKEFSTITLRSYCQQSTMTLINTKKNRLHVSFIADDETADLPITAVDK